MPNDVDFSNKAQSNTVTSGTVIDSVVPDYDVMVVFNQTATRYLYRCNIAGLLEGDYVLVPGVKNSDMELGLAKVVEIKQAVTSAARVRIICKVDDHGYLNARKLEQQYQQLMKAADAEMKAISKTKKMEDILGADHPLLLEIKKIQAKMGNFIPETSE